eukprot:12902764-Prorocentrum_lima.AAC.1
MWKRVNSRLVDKCLEDACCHGIYMPPMTDHQWCQLDRLMDIEHELLYGQDAGPSYDIEEEPEEEPTAESAVSPPTWCVSIAQLIDVSTR